MALTVVLSNALLSAAALVATVGAARRLVGTDQAVGFPWHLGSCKSIETLTPAEVRQAMDWGASSSGNNGGVHFLALEKGCIVVLKPKIDAHELFAHELGMAMKAPVLSSRALKEGDPMFDAVLQGILKGAGGTLGEEARDMFVSSMNPSRVIMMMGLAPGKDPYDLTAGWDYKACSECAAEAAEEATAEKMGDTETERIQAVKYQIEDGAVSPFYKGFVDEVMEQKGLKPGTPELAAAVEEWMIANKADARNPLRKIAAQRKSEYSRQLQMAQKCANRNGAKEQDVPTLAKVTDYIKECASSKPAIDGFAALSAFLSIIGENDGMPTVDSPYVSNMHNVFISPAGVVGIDMAVGGALTHNSIRADGSGGQFLGNWTPFLLNDLIRADRCKADVEPETVQGAGAFMAQISLKLRQPYFNTDIHKYATSCQLERGSTISVEEAESAAEWINGLVPGHLRSLLSGIGTHIRNVQKRLAHLGHPDELRNIVGWLEKRIAKLVAAEREASSTCGVVPSQSHRELLKCIAEVWEIAPEVAGASSCDEVFSIAFGRHGEEAAEKMPGCVGLTHKSGLGSCCVEACVGSPSSRLGCLKDCQKLKTANVEGSS